MLLIYAFAFLAFSNSVGAQQALRKKGIIIRFFGSQGGDLNNFIRISAGKPEHTDAVMAALAQIGSDPDNQG